MATLRVGAALPDPPFNGMPGGGGLDIDLINAIGAALGMTVELVAYGGADFNDIFGGLESGCYDCVIAGTTVTPERQRRAAFAAPYLISGQSLAVNTDRLRSVSSIDDLAGLTIGVQRGNTSQPIAEDLVAARQGGGRAALRLRRHLARDRRPEQRRLRRVHEAGAGAHRAGPRRSRCRGGAAGHLREPIAIAVTLGDKAMLARISDAQAEPGG